MADEQTPVRGQGVGSGDMTSIAASLRRPSSLNTGNPTRTLHISATEKSSRDNTPTPISVEELSRRPRSNPRSRTPMRYESPLQNDAFRARSPSPVHEETPRITIRPLTGSAIIGTVLRTIIDEDRRPVTPKSKKQGPSNRKIRRWNRDHFAGLAAEIASSSARGVISAEVILKAQRDAHLYRSVYDPKEHCRSEQVNRFMEDDAMKVARDQFFEGAGPMPAISSSDYPRGSGALKKGPLTAVDMLNRMDPRLRRMLVRACQNSYAAEKVVGFFEEFVVCSFTKGEKKLNSLDECWWKDLLLGCPAITQHKDNVRYTAQFFFHATSQTGGFHRLLLHAVCQFHGLNAVSRMVHNVAFGNDTTKARTLIVTGIMEDLSPYRLLKYLSKQEEESSIIRDASVIEQMSALRV